MKSISRLLFIALVVKFCVLTVYGFTKKPVKILVFSKTTGYRHKSISSGIIAIQNLGRENRFLVDTSENSAVFTLENLKGYKAVIFLSTTGNNLFNEEQKAAFKEYINQGGGFVGIHAATDCFYNWEWYGKLVGGYFKSHPKIQEATLTILDTKHPSTRNLKSPWVHTDEWYNFKSLSTHIKPLINLEEASYKGGENGDFHPIAWYHKFEGGRVFYTGLGHTEAAYSNTSFLKHLLGGIKYAADL